MSTQLATVTFIDAHSGECDEIDGEGCYLTAARAVYVSRNAVPGWVSEGDHVVASKTGSDVVAAGVIGEMTPVYRRSGKATMLSLK